LLDIKRLEHFAAHCVFFGPNKKKASGSVSSDDMLDKDSIVPEVNGHVSVELIVQP
jgi:hypothetical protein